MRADQGADFLTPTLKALFPDPSSFMDMDAAAAIVTLGCALPGKEAVAEKVAAWEGVPSPSENYQAARDDIVKRVQSLVDELAKKESQPKGKKKAKR